MTARFPRLPALSPVHLSHSLNSYLSITSHSASYNLRLGWISGPLAFAFRTGILTYKLHRPPLRVR